MADEPMRIVLITATFAAGALARAAPAADAFSGSAYALDGDRLLYRETHIDYRDAQGGEGVVLYQCPDGAAFARKRSHDDGDPQTPDFDLVDARLGYREGVRETSGGREVYVQRTRDKPEQSAPLALPADGVIDTGFDVFVQRHWDALVRGETLRFDFLVPSRRTFFPFQAERVDNPPQAPPGAITFRLASASWFAFLLPHIDVSYALATRQPVRYAGLSNVRDLRGKNYRVRFEYPKITVRHDITRADIAAALAEPLVSSCTGADNPASAAGQAGMPDVTVAPAARNPTR